MSKEQLKAFLEAVKADAGLQEKLKGAADVDAVVAIAKASGFEISAEDLAKAQAELSDEELGGVAGGVINIFHFGMYGTGNEQAAVSNAQLSMIRDILNK